MKGDAEMDVMTHSFKGLGYKGEERHKVVEEEEECGVQGGFIFKGNDTEMQMERGRGRER